MSGVSEGELTSLAFCWRIERRDGMGVALTSHDAALEIGGVQYEPAPGMTPAAIRRRLGLEPGSSEVAGALTSAAIREEDMRAGRWDGARLSLFAVDWFNADGEQIALLDGELGQVASRDGSFTAELAGPAARLDGAVCPSTSPQCRAMLGDAHCRVDMGGRTVRAVVVATDGTKWTLDRAVDERFRFGTVRVLGGAANGLCAIVLKAEGSSIWLRTATPEAVLPNTAVQLTEGCDKRLESCAVRFGNAANFRGEPHLPGNDLLTRYPGG